jgi:hypothetical protein
MAKPKKDDQQLTVVAELTLTHPGGTEVVRSFDKAWHRMLEMAKTSPPVSCRHTGFVRKTDEEIAA